MTYTTQFDVEKVFNRIFGVECVERIDETTTKDSHECSFKMFFVHFNQSILNQKMKDFKSKLENENMVQVMTGKGSWFWKVYLNKSKSKGPKVVEVVEVEEYKFGDKELDNDTASDGIDLELGEGFTEEELDELDKATEEINSQPAELDDEDLDLEEETQLLEELESEADKMNELHK
jgi:hypothetical protein